MPEESVARYTGEVVKRFFPILFVLMPMQQWHPQLQEAINCYELHQGPSAHVTSYEIFVVTDEVIKSHHSGARAVSYSGGRIYIEQDDFEALEHEFLHHVLWANNVPTVFHHYWMEFNAIDFTCDIIYVR